MAHSPSPTEPLNPPLRLRGNTRLRSLRELMFRHVVLIAALQILLGFGIARLLLYPQLEGLQIEMNATLAGNVGQVTQKAVMRTMVAVRAAARQLIATPERSGPLAQATLAQLADGHEAAESAYILDRHGRVTAVAHSLNAPVAGGNGERMGLDLSQSEVFKATDKSDLRISPIFLSAISDQPTIAVTAPLNEGALLVMEINLSRLVQKQGEVQAYHGVQVLIIDGRGQILADSAGNKSSQSSMMGVDALQAIESKSATVVSIDEARWLVSASDVWVDRLDWRVLVMRPEALVYGPITTIVLMTALTTGVVLALTFVVLYLVTRRIADSTEILSQNAHALQSGNIPAVRALVAREFAEVDENLRSMALTLIHRENLLKQTNLLLEQRVQERTSHLQVANAEIEQTVRKLESTQNELVQAGKMAALGSMVAGISHELNTPVGNARLTASTLVHTAQSMQDLLDGGKVSRMEIMRCTEAMREGAQLIDRSLERAADIVRSFKQVAVDQTSNRRRTFLLHEVIHENHVLLSPRLAKAGVAVNVQCPTDLEMNGYPGVLGQVLTNLMENAILHGYGGLPGGSIDIDAQTLGADEVRLQVRDYGKGIAADSISRVFDPFFTTRLGQGGSGLGLSIVYSLITHSLAGKVSVSSEHGQGTVFTLDLPVHAPVTDLDEKSMG
jgi:C4-dicarboxylate-specific signal transduction histidine kinase